MQLKTMELEPPPAFRLNDKYHMTMGLKKLDPDEWALVDKNYLAFHRVRKEILDDAKLNAETVRVADGKDIMMACVELLDLVTAELTRKYPQFFTLLQERGRRATYNKLTQETFDLDMPFGGFHPLEIVARLATEDFNILIKDRPQHILYVSYVPSITPHMSLTVSFLSAASVTLFPAGWRLQDRFGWSITNLHGLVPDWKNKLSKPVEQYVLLANAYRIAIYNFSFFTRLSHESPMRRDPFFIQLLPTATSQPISVQTLIIQDPESFFPNTDRSRTIHPSRILLRRERQTFRRLPKSGAVVFGVRTSVSRLTELTPEECEGLGHEVSNWPESMWKYKGGEVWGKALMEYCEAVVKKAHYAGAIDG